MNAHGLAIDRREGSTTVPVRAITPGALGSGLELVLLAVKSHDTPAALEVLAPRLAGDGAIVSLQNGLNEELIARAVGAERTVGCLVNWAADWTAPGRILHGGEGALVRGVPRPAGAGAGQGGVARHAQAARARDRRPRARVGEPRRGAGVRLHRADAHILRRRGGAA